MNFNFFSSNGSEASQIDENKGNATSHNEPSQYEGHYTYKKYGFFQSKNHGADPIALKVELKKVIESFRDKVRRDEVEQEKLKIPIRKNIEAWRAESEKIKKDAKKVKDLDIATVKQEIGQKKEEISNIRKHPEQYRDDKPNKISFIFGSVVLLFLTVYLWIFYTSASYSAFFRKFEVDDINVANSMFDARAISKAYLDGVPAFVLVISMPFIFLALGYLIHKFNEKKGFGKYVSLSFLILVTFGFDYIIAYEIVQQVYDLKAMNSLGDIPEYKASMAFEDINFWLIIFAGFVTYLIWGFLFDKLMHTYEQFDLVKVQIKIREREIKELQKEIKAKEQELKEMENRVFELDKQIKQGMQDLEATFFKQKDFEYVVYQFSSGWMQFIEGGLIMSEEKRKSLRQETKDVIEAFIQQNNNGIFHERA